jgi:hypothetical protein
VDCSFVCCDYGMCSSCHGRSCVASVLVQEIGVVQLSRQGVLPVIHVNASGCREIVCVRHEAIWWCRGIAPLVLNIGTGGEG